MSQGRKMDQEIGKTSLLAIKNDTLLPTENLICREYITLGRHTNLTLHSFCWVFSMHSENPMWCLHTTARDFSCGSSDFGLTTKPLVTSEVAHFFWSYVNPQISSWISGIPPTISAVPVCSFLAPCAQTNPDCGAPREVSGRVWVGKELWKQVPNPLASLGSKCGFRRLFYMEEKKW